MKYLGLACGISQVYWKSSFQLLWSLSYFSSVAAIFWNAFLVFAFYMHFRIFLVQTISFVLVSTSFSSKKKDFAQIFLLCRRWKNFFRNRNENSQFIFKKNPTLEKKNPFTMILWIHDTSYSCIDKAEKQMDLSCIYVWQNK